MVEVLMNASVNIGNNEKILIRYNNEIFIKNYFQYVVVGTVCLFGRCCLASIL